MSNLCIIPARGGSKRIPRKNIKPFLGKPIIAYSIEAAIRSNLFEEVMVSTDDEEIANVAIKYGASVPFYRSIAASDDFATTVDVLFEVLNEYNRRGQKFDVICCIYPTAPLLSTDRLKEAYRKMVQSNLDSIFPVVQFSYPVLRGLELTEDNKIKMIWPEHLKSRSQDLKPVYHDSGSCYWVKIDSFINEKTLICENGGAIVLPEYEVQDIDNETDWKLAELKHKLLNA